MDKTYTLYPVPNKVAEVFESSRFRAFLSCEGNEEEECFVHESENDNPVSDLTLKFMQEKNHFVKMRLGGKAKFRVKRKDGKEIKTCVIRPLEYGIVPTIEGDSVSFTMDTPHNISVEIDENFIAKGDFNNIGPVEKNIVKHPLFFFANPPEKDIPDPDDPDWVYFGPGIHEVGLNTQIPNGSKIYIAGGAIVKGGGVANQSNPEDITIRGNGVITGYGMHNTSDGWVDHAIAFPNGNKGGNLYIEGITICAPLRSSIVSYNQTTIEWVSIMTWQHRRDGITAGANSKMIGEVFLKSQDDLLKFYYGSLDFSRCHIVVWQQTSGSPGKMGWDLKQHVHSVRVGKMTVIHSDVFSDYSNADSDRPDLYSTSALVSVMGINKTGKVTDIIFDDVVVEEPSLLRLIGVRFTSFQGGKQWGSPSPEMIFSGVVFNKLTLAGVPLCKSFIYANGGGSAGKMTFNNFTIAGKPVLSLDDWKSVNDGVGIVFAANGGGTVDKNPIFTQDAEVVDPPGVIDPETPDPDEMEMIGEHISLDLTIKNGRIVLKASNQTNVRNYERNIFDLLASLTRSSKLYSKRSKSKAIRGSERPD